MARQKLDKKTREVLLEARGMIEEAVRKDANEAETRARVRHIFGLVMGYDVFKHITAEYAIHGTGNTVHCDIAIQLEPKESSGPTMLVELKKVNIDLTLRHLRQATGYAFDIGCDWILLTNGKEWKLYHISFVKPPETKLLASWDIINDTPVILAKKFDLISYKNVKRGSLPRLWEKTNVLTAQNILKAILSERSIRLIRGEIKKATDFTVSPEDIIGAVRPLLNDAALTEMAKITISLPAKKQQKRKVISNISKEEEEKPVEQLEETVETQGGAQEQNK